MVSEQAGPLSLVAFKNQPQTIGYIFLLPPDLITNLPFLCVRLFVILPFAGMSLLVSSQRLFLLLIETRLVAEHMAGREVPGHHFWANLSSAAGSLAVPAERKGQRIQPPSQALGRGGLPCPAPGGVQRDGVIDVTDTPMSLRVGAEPLAGCFRIYNVPNSKSI